jgi:hypothetical protein
MPFYQYRMLRENEFIVAGSDLSAGLNDYCVTQFISKKYLDIPLVYREKCIATKMTNDVYPVLERIYDKTGCKPLIAYERNNGGIYEMDRLANLNRDDKFEIYKMKTHGTDDNKETPKFGIDTTGISRPAMLIALKNAIDNNFFRIYDKQTIEELFSFIKVRTNTLTKAQAENNSHDDCVMALALAVQVFIDSCSNDDRISAMATMTEEYYERNNNVERGKAGYG